MNVELNDAILWSFLTTGIFIIVFVILSWFAGVSDISCQNAWEMGVQDNFGGDPPKLIMGLNPLCLNNYFDFKYQLYYDIGYSIGN